MNRFQWRTLPAVNNLAWCNPSQVWCSCNSLMAPWSWSLSNQEACSNPWCSYSQCSSSKWPWWLLSRWLWCRLTRGTPTKSATSIIARITGITSADGPITAAARAVNHVMAAAKSVTVTNISMKRWSIQDRSTAHTPTSTRAVSTVKTSWGRTSGRTRCATAGLSSVLAESVAYSLLWFTSPYTFLASE